ncbi:MAG TPA: hypothetical protein VKF17_01030 [Isosphaeraceae bacterium]|nr:hypothetical protein [Isosphaeraceae bacterium]
MAVYSQEFDTALPEGTRAAALPDSGIELPSGFLTTFGRPGARAPASASEPAGCNWDR